MSRIPASQQPIVFGLEPEPRRSGLTDTDLVRAERILPLLGADWNIDRHEDHAGVVSLIITSADDDENAPVFALHAEGLSIQAGVVEHDRYRILGRDPRIEQAFRRIVAHLRGDRPLAA